MTDIIIILIVAAILGLAGGYVYKAKRRGEKCIGCPQSRNCAGCRSSCSDCSGPTK